jgi:SAM-dependent methyltransferase
VNPFLDPSTCAGLYATPRRLTERTTALLTARRVGTPVADVLCELAAQALPETVARNDSAARATHDAGAGLRILDIGCGRGSTTRALGRHFPVAQLMAYDAAPALLAAARERLQHLNRPASTHVLAGDFHHLPVADASLDLAVAAFCLYHSATPARPLAEIRRTLRPGGAAIVVTKSRTSYTELDRLVAAAGLDPAAPDRPSLYDSVHSDNIADLITGADLALREVRHDEHEFRFSGLDHAAAYLATSPKYALPDGLAGDPDALATALRARLPDRPITTWSRVTYAVGIRRPP